MNLNSCSYTRKLLGFVRAHGEASKAFTASQLNNRRAAALISEAHSAAPRCLDGGDVDLLHRHHRLERTLCFIAASRHCIG
jgi:hypothetical protein